MGRKADPRGKDRPRTVVLSGDVAEIAQKLADKGELSLTLSDLLRQSYGFGDKIDEKKRELEATHAARIDLQRKEEDLAQQISELEVQALEQETTLAPSIKKRIAILEGRQNLITHKLSRCFIPNERVRLESQLHTVSDLIKEANEELEALN